MVPEEGDDQVFKREVAPRGERCRFPRRIEHKEESTKSCPPRLLFEGEGTLRGKRKREPSPEKTSLKKRGFSILLGREKGDF